MLIEAHDAETGKRFSKEAKELDGSTLEELLSMQLTRQDVTDMIDNLDVSADVKVLLDRIAQATITIGGAVVWIGRIILKAILFLLGEFSACEFRSHSRRRAGLPSVHDCGDRCRAGRPGYDSPCNPWRNIWLDQRCPVPDVQGPNP